MASTYSPLPYAVLIDRKNAGGLNEISRAEAEKEGVEGKVIRYTARHAGTGTDYLLPNGDVRMSLRFPYGSYWSLVEVYVGEKEDPSVVPLHLYTAWKKETEKK